MTDALVPKSSENFYCQKCDYYTSHKSQFVRHKFTLKHPNTDKLLTNTDAKSSESSAAIKLFNIWIR